MPKPHPGVLTARDALGILRFRAASSVTERGRHEGRIPDPEGHQDPEGPDRPPVKQLCMSGWDGRTDGPTSHLEASTLG